MSRRHAQLVLDTQGRLYIYDLGSLNGTWVAPFSDKQHPRRIKHTIARLYDGDRITMGSIVVSDGQQYVPLVLKVSIRNEAVRHRLEGSPERPMNLPGAHEAIPRLGISKEELKICLGPLLDQYDHLWDCMESAGHGCYGVPLSAVYDDGDDMSDEFEDQPAAPLPLDISMSMVAAVPASDTPEDDVGSEPEVFSSHRILDVTDTPSDSDQQSDASESDHEGDDAAVFDQASLVGSPGMHTLTQDHLAQLESNASGEEAEEEESDEESGEADEPMRNVEVLPTRECDARYLFDPRVLIVALSACV